MRVALIAKPGHADTGVGRYTAQLRAALEALGHEVTLVHPTAPLPGIVTRAVQRLLGWDLAAFFNNYPVWARYPQADLYHVASQNLATLLLWRRPPGKTVVTVHDVIPWLTRHDPQLRVYNHAIDEWFDRLALAGLRRADRLMADSAFTRESLQRAGLAVGDAIVVELAVE
jgi:hypothetical protein